MTSIDAGAEGAAGRRGLADNCLEGDRLPIGLVEVLFDETPGVLFFAKDIELRYIASNKAQRVLCGVRSDGALRGRSARDFFPDVCRARYEALDRDVMRSRRPSVARLGLSEPRRGRPHWLLCKHWPVLAGDGALIGAAGISRRIEPSARNDRTCRRVALAAEHMHAHFDRPLALRDLADATGVSRSQLERDFGALFGVSPQTHLGRIRVSVARDLLHGASAIAEIALACGYSDQSGFARRFRAEVGVSPAAYRKQLRARERAWA